MQHVVRWAACAAMFGISIFASVTHAATENSSGTSVQNLGYSHKDILEFMAKAKSAEQIEEPLQRCLAYPDPPGSHWTPAAVRTYCHYRFQPLMSASDIEGLIRSRQFAELDGRLKAALEAQQTDPSAPSRLNLIYDHAFTTDAKELRPLLDQWKSTDPQSAFAYAASAWLYMQMASTARGEKYESDTPPANLEKMKELLAYAEADSYKSISLDPRVMPAYIALILGANIAENSEYATLWIDRALAVSPADFTVYSQASLVLEPRWHGSIKAMQDLEDRAQTHVKTNPMLALLKNDAAFYEVDHCGCGAQQQAIRYSALLDELTTSGNLWNAGDAASDSGAAPAAMVLLSETLRFNPAALRARSQRSLRLTDLGDAAWALQEANIVIKKDPTDAAGFSGRAFALESMHDYPNAEIALKKAIHFDPSDSWQLIELGNIHFLKHEWHEAWDISGELVTKFPNEPYGWILRGNIQMDQPRAGLKDTFDEFNKRFGSDPQWGDRLDQMREGLQHEQQRSAIDTAAPLKQKRG
jgi:tetratricopeptide (TPR) repeat protein